MLALLWIFCIPLYAYSQTFSSRNNHSGDWEASSTWSPLWNNPSSNLSGTNITINGYVTVNGPLAFTGSSSKLTINDTLVIKGDLSLGDNNDLTINENGILIVRGSIITGNQTAIIANGYIIVTGDYTKNGSMKHGLFSSNDNPEKVFICGTISPSGISDQNPRFPALDCIAPATSRYPGTNCSYGNMTDLKNDPIYSFFQTTCLAPKPTISAGGPLTFCAGGSVTLTSDAGSTYQWSNGATTPTVTINSSGSYTVKTSNAAGCISASSVAVVVTANSIPLTPTIVSSGPTSFCSGSNIILTSSTGINYLWSTGATTASINVGTAGNYSVRIKDSKGCQSASSLPVTVTVNTASVPTIAASGPLSFCSGGNVTLNASTGSSYLWSTGATTRSLNITTSGSYSVKVTDENGCQSPSSANSLVTVNTNPVVSAGLNTTIPYGTSTTLNSTVTGSSPFTYIWTPSANLVSSTIEDPATVNLTSTTVFNLKATSSISTCSGSGEVTVSISGGPLSSSPTASPSTVCAGSPVQLHSSAGGGSGTYTYSWTSSPAGFTSSLASPVVNPLVTTIYTVNVSDGFTNITTPVTVNVNPVPATPVITPDGPLIFCDGGSVKLQSSAGTNFLWSDGETTSSININSSGNYSVRTSNASGCFSPISSSAIITVNPLPLKPTITPDGPTSLCEGASVNLTSSSESGYLWSNGEVNKTININSSGNYSVRVTNDKGCQSPTSLTIAIIMNPVPTVPVITTTNPTTFCEGGSVILTGSSAFSYLWSNGATTQDINVTSSGTYKLVTGTPNGCLSKESIPVLVTVNTPPSVPTISSSGPLVFCSGNSVTLTSSTGSNFRWSDGSSTQSIDVSSANNYNVRIIDNNGCESLASDQVEVVVNDNPVINAGPDQELDFTFETQMNAMISTIDSGEWSLVSGSGHISDINSPTTKITGLGSGENIFKWTVSNSSCELSEEVIIKVKDEFVPSVITPNGDGKNDYFKISDYPGTVGLIIINRWGNLEYNNNSYSNNWDGRNNKGSELPTDTYFYILKFDNGKTLKGSVLIKR